MREILFRGKTADGVWVYGCYTKYSNYEGYITEDLLENKVESVLANTVGQYTGNTDRNFKGIFEGDKVRAYKHNETEHVCTVKFLNGCFMFGNWSWHEYLNIFRRPEVIGNIHESEVQK